MKRSRIVLRHAVAPPLLLRMKSSMHDEQVVDSSGLPSLQTSQLTGHAESIQVADSITIIHSPRSEIFSSFASIFKRT